MNLYATLAGVKAGLSITNATSDALLMVYLAAASRHIDQFCRRVFFTFNQAQVFDGRDDDELLLGEDLLAVSALATDTDGDGLFDDQTWAAGDYELLPANRLPAYGLRRTRGGDYAWPTTQSSIRITGTWGHGNATASPWRASGVTMTAASAEATAATASAAGAIEAGHTLLVGSEQVFVSAVNGTALTIERGVNGTTAAIHAAAAASIALYPEMVGLTCQMLASEMFNTLDDPGVTQERMGDYSVSRAADASILASPQAEVLARLLTGYVKP